MFYSELVSNALLIISVPLQLFSFRNEWVTMLHFLFRGNVTLMITQLYFLGDGNDLTNYYYRYFISSIAYKFVETNRFVLFS